MAQLPIFPLGTVLFPGQALPLRVFEPRYVALLSDLFQAPGEQRSFGVVALRRGNEVGTESTPELASTGTAALVTNVRSGAGGPTGVMYALLARGTRRFRLESFDADATPYYLGTVTWLDDRPADAEELRRALDDATVAYEAFQRATDGPAGPFDAAPEQLAYEIASAISLPVEDRQSLLAVDDPAGRLRLVSRLLRREAVLFGGLGLAPTERYTFDPPSRN